MDRTENLIVQGTQKFVKDRAIKWYRCKVDPVVMRELVKRSDLQGFRQSLGHLGLSLATGSLAYLAYLKVSGANWFWSVPLLLVALFVHGTFMNFVGGVACHELMHRTPFKTKILNEFFLRFFSFIGWWDHVSFRYSHIKHHQVTVHNDYDGEVVLPAKLTLRDWQFWLRLFAWNPLYTRDVLKNYFKRVVGYMDSEWHEFVIPASNRRLRRQHRNWALFTLIGHVALAALFIATDHWFLIVLLNGKHYCHWLGFACTMPQHFGLSSNVSDFRLCCRTFTCSWLTSFLYWNMHYHIEHHMFPAVPFFNLPKLRVAIACDLPDAPHGLQATWEEILKIHRKQIVNPEYTFVPELPQAGGGVRTDDEVLEQEAALPLS